jgi:hypothetical protein
MLEAVTSSITTVLGWIGTVIDSLLTTDGDLNQLLPLFAVGVGISAILLGRLYAEFKSGKNGENCDVNPVLS